MHEEMITHAIIVWWWPRMVQKLLEENFSIYSDWHACT